MKNKQSLPSLIIAALALSLGAFTSFADENHKHKSESGHGHSHYEKEAGPNGGRIVEGDGFKLEFFVKEDRKVQISFLNDHGKIRAPKDETVSLIGGDRSDPTSLQFEKNGNVLLSKDTLPDIKNMPAILQIEPSQGAKMIRERFNINMSTCPDCALHEYACICGHEE